MEQRATSQLQHPASFFIREDFYYRTRNWKESNRINDCVKSGNICEVENILCFFLFSVTKSWRTRHTVGKANLSSIYESEWKARRTKWSIEHMLLRSYFFILIEINRRNRRGRVCVNACCMRSDPLLAFVSASLFSCFLFILQRRILTKTNVNKSESSAARQTQLHRFKVFVFVFSFCYSTSWRKVSQDDCRVSSMERFLWWWWWWLWTYFNMSKKFSFKMKICSVNLLKTQPKDVIKREEEKLVKKI